MDSEESKDYSGIDPSHLCGEYLTETYGSRRFIVLMRRDLSRIKQCISEFTTVRRSSCRLRR
jgi:hypothetical protein